MADDDKLYKAAKDLMSKPGFGEGWTKAYKAGEEEYNRYKDPEALAKKQKEDSDFFAQSRAKRARKSATKDAQDRGQIPQFRKGGMVGTCREYKK